MKLGRRDYEFNNTKICQMWPRQIHLDTMLINLYILLKHDGRRLVAKTGRQEVTIDLIVNQLIDRHGDTLKGFADHRDVVQDWIYSDLVHMINRGVEGKPERVSAPLPLHLNAFKLRNPDQAKDARTAEHMYSMIRAGDPGLVQRLTDFLGAGMDSTTRETYDEQTPLDLDTLAIVRMVDNPNLVERPATDKGPLDPPLCIGQSRLLVSDLRRLLAYKDVVPRPVLIGYLRTAMGFHLGLYLMRLFRQVTDWVDRQEAHPTCVKCPVRPEVETSCFTGCPYAFQNADANNPLAWIIVDMGDDGSSHMARLAQENCASHYSAMGGYMQAVFTINQLFQYAQSHGGQRELGSRANAQTVAEVLEIMHDPPAGMDAYFANRIDAILPPDELGEELDEVLAIRNMRDLAPLAIFIQLISATKIRSFQPNFVNQLDSLFMKNQETGLVRQGKGKKNPRRWHIASGLLEVLVQIAVLESIGGGGGGALHSRPILIDEFVSWLKQRYGLVIMPNLPEASIHDYQAFNLNMNHLKNRLREIGFYTDLSDAYNTQIIHPRYPIEAGQ